MQQLLQYFVLLPLAGFLISLLLPKNKEKIISFTAITTAGIQLIFLIYFAFNWLKIGSPILNIKQLVLYKTEAFEFFIGFYFDYVAAVFLLVGSLIILMVAVFSKYYLHRESGYKRYFNNIQFFFLGYSIIITAGNFETLFVGWEAVGVSSFVLIAFYRDRFLPVKNAFKIISLFRLGDVFLILAMWLAHHLWHTNIAFNDLIDNQAIKTISADHVLSTTLIACMLLLAASIKSALFPFSSWVPRAMEGPSSSSAIFYGSLSIHLGIFLMLRTYPLWENLLFIKIMMISFGVATSLAGNTIAKVQSTAKTQIAYVSIVQIGIIFIEVALGLHLLALVHFAANAFFRTYQLLVSPSVLGYLIHNQIFNFKTTKSEKNNAFKNTMYTLGIKEFNMDKNMHTVLWKPFKWCGYKLGILNTFQARSFLLLLIIVAPIAKFNGLFDLLPSPNLLQLLYASIALILLLLSFTERQTAKRAWTNIILAQLAIINSIAVLGEVPITSTSIYLLCVLIFGGLGFHVLSKLYKAESDIELNKYHGHSHEYPKQTILFLICCLGIGGFPISPLFIGIDLFFTHVSTDQIGLISILCLCILFLEIAVLRIFIRLYFGQHKKTYHPIAYKSS
jgi:NADH:ubiquinone oxidoreductase subunit 5 (subunit L)/multisubunit Na+/H+ antiporter MnhA subunit